MNVQIISVENPNETEEENEEGKEKRGRNKKQSGEKRGQPFKIKPQNITRLNESDKSTCNCRMVQGSKSEKKKKQKRKFNHSSENQTKNIQQQLKNVQLRIGNSLSFRYTLPYT